MAREGKRKGARNRKEREENKRGKRMKEMETDGEREMERVKETE